MATVTSKGQITIPADVRRALGLSAGSKVRFVPTDAGTYELVPEKRSVMDLDGFLAYKGKPKTLEEMQEGIVEGAIGDFDW